jgi:hypothetical protein
MNGPTPGMTSATILTRHPMAPPMRARVSPPTAAPSGAWSFFLCARVELTSWGLDSQRIVRKDPNWEAVVPQRLRAILCGSFANGVQGQSNFLQGVSFGPR